VPRPRGDESDDAAPFKRSVQTAGIAALGASSVAAQTQETLAAGRVRRGGFVGEPGRGFPLSSVAAFSEALSTACEHKHQLHTEACSIRREHISERSINLALRSLIQKWDAGRQSITATLLRLKRKWYAEFQIRRWCLMAAEIRCHPRLPSA
jgi:hypothetical protein